MFDNKEKNLNSIDYDYFIEVVKVSIEKKDFFNITKYFDYVYENASEAQKKELLMVLFLLNIITNIPDKYKKIIKKIGYQDVCLKVLNSDIDYVQNKIRKLIFSYNFSYALDYMYKLVAKQGYMKKNDIVLNKLILEANNSYNNNQEVNRLFRQEEYEKLIIFLEKLKTENSIRTYQEYLLMLLKSYLKLKNNIGSIEITVFNTFSLREAIEGNNFELARAISGDYSKKKNCDNLLYEILSKICYLIESEKNVEIDTNTNRVFIKSKTNEEIVEHNANKMKKINFLYEKICQNIKNKNFSELLNDLDQYLTENNCSNYKFLILELIEISLLLDDPDFKEPLLILSKMKDGTFEFNAQLYVQRFEDYIAYDMVDVAKRYLKIILKSNKLLNESKINRLKKLLNLKEDMNLKNEKCNLQMKRYIQDIRLQAKEDGIVLISSDIEKKYGTISDVTVGMADISSFTIKNATSYDVVLRYTPILIDSFNIQQMVVDGRNKYREGLYEECISIYRKVLMIGRPHFPIYAILSMSYLKQKNIKLATAYLKVALQLCKEEKKSYYDFFGLVDEFIEYTNLSACELCDTLGLENNLKYLIVARQCYQISDYETGDFYLEKIDNSSEKNSFISQSCLNIKNEKFGKKYKKIYKVFEGKYDN